MVWDESAMTKVFTVRKKPRNTIKRLRTYWRSFLRDPGPAQDGTSDLWYGDSCLWVFPLN